jgi:hypothetical protein
LPKCGRSGIFTDYNIVVVHRLCLMIIEIMNMNFEQEQKWYESMRTYKEIVHCTLT